MLVARGPELARGGVGASDRERLVWGKKRVRSRGSLEVLALTNFAYWVAVRVKGAW